METEPWPFRPLPPTWRVPLPLFLAGLTHGLPAVVIAGAVGTLISALNGLLSGGIYLVTFAAPAVLVVRQALLARPATEASANAEVHGDLEWYPAGRLVVWLVGWALGLFALALLLTADRPPELRAVGANQAIDQVGIFGNYPAWSFDLPCPTGDVPLTFVCCRCCYKCTSSENANRQRLKVKC